MNLKHLSDKCLLEDTKKLVSQERQLVTVILQHLAEVQRRRLFSEVGCSSLFAYCTEVLKYSEAQAHQKISAMRLMIEVPELEKKIEKGEISVTNVAQAQSFFRQEAKATKVTLPIEMKKEVLKKLESASTRQGQRILLSLSSQSKPVVVERERPVSPELTEIKFAADDVLLRKLKKLKSLMAHKKSGMSYSELINELCEIGLNKLDPVRKAERTEKRRSDKERKAVKPGFESEAIVDVLDVLDILNVEDALNVVEVDGAKDEGGMHSEQYDQGKSYAVRKNLAKSQEDRESNFEDCQISSELRRVTPENSPTKFNNRRITSGDPRNGASKRRAPAAVQDQVWLRAKGVCENCESVHALQLDHRVPYSLGGNSKVENMRVLCRNCNQRAAINKIGANKLAPFIHL